MAVEYGDIWPQASGSSALGIEMTNGGFTNQLRPFAAAAINSGVFPFINGTSGVMRFAWGDQQPDGFGTSVLPAGKLPAFEFSTDGGLSFPIRIGTASGTINELNAGILQKFVLLEAAEGRAFFMRGSGLYSYVQGDVRFSVLPLDGDSSQRGQFRVDTYDAINLSTSLCPQGYAAGINLQARSDVTLRATEGSITFEADTTQTSGKGQAIFNLGDQFIVNVYKASPVTGGSGLLRYQFGPYEGWYWRSGNTIGFPLGGVLPSSGAVNQMVQASRADIGSGLQKTYDASREALLLLPSNLNAPGLLFKLRDGTRNLRPDDVRGFVPSYGVAVSGFTSAISNPHSYGVSFLSHNALSIQGSGTAQANLWMGLNPITNAPLITTSGTLNITGSGLSLASQDFITFVSIGNQVFTVGGVFSANATGGVNLSSSNNSINLSASTIGLTASNDVSIEAQNNTITLETGGFNNDIRINPVGDAFIEAQNHSGKLSYRFGPYQSWHQFNSCQVAGGTANDGFFPIPHSGHINQMIQSARADIGSGLQNDYNANRRMTLNSAIGNLEIISNTAKTKFAGTTVPYLNLSGVYTRPTSTLELGDFYLMAHSAVEDLGVNTEASDAATASAKALGLATPVLNTGSGLISVVLASGVMQCVNNGAQTLTTVFTDVNLNTITATADQNYTLSASPASGVITVMSPGLYKITYKVAFTKTVGTNPQTAEVRLVVNNNGAAVLGSTIDSFMFDAVNAAKSSASAIVFQNLNAGDNVRLQANSTLAGADNCQIPNRGAIFAIEKIGSKRGVF